MIETASLQVKKVQDVGVAGQLLGEFVVVGGELCGEVGGCSSGAAAELVHDLLPQNVAGPAVLGGGGRVPVALGLVADLVEQDSDVTPGESSNSLLDNCSSSQAAAIWRM